ncbi:MAG: hypothetical protein ABIS01_09660 [Ferruginibacter sp.]
MNTENAEQSKEIILKVVNSPPLKKAINLITPNSGGKILRNKSEQELPRKYIRPHFGNDKRTSRR